MMNFYRCSGCGTLFLREAQFVATGAPEQVQHHGGLCGFPLEALVLRAVSDETLRPSEVSAIVKVE